MEGWGLGRPCCWILIWLVSRDECRCCDFVARIEYEETASSLKTAAVWGGIAIILCFVKAPPVVALLVAAVVGALNGCANLLLLWRMKTELVTACNWVGLFALLAAAFALHNNGPKPMNAMQCLTLGCVCVAVRSGVFGFFKDPAVNAINQKYHLSLAALDDDKPEIPKPKFDNAHQAHQSFLSVLPSGLREDYRECITQAVIATHSAAPAVPFQSALGGSPLLPLGVAWPMWRDIPLDYLARINLAELPPAEFARPAHGILEFFFGSDAHEQQPWGVIEDDQGSGSVIFIPDPAIAVYPSKPETAGLPSAHVPLEFHLAEVMAETEEMNDRFYEYARPLPGKNREQTYAIRDAKDDFAPFGHRVLSPPARVQGDMDDDLARAAQWFGLPPGTPWVMLLQLESDKAVDWTWCDDGAIYFWIPAADLAQGRFDRVWVILQSP